MEKSANKHNIVWLFNPKLAYSTCFYLEDATQNVSVLGKDYIGTFKLQTTPPCLKLSK